MEGSASEEQADPVLVAQRAVGTFEKLIDFRESSDPGIKYFSGIATYIKTADIAQEKMDIALHRLEAEVPGFQLRQVVAEAVLPLQASGQLVGAFNVDVEGTFYDVRFVDGTCIDLYEGCDEVGDFPFPTAELAEAAAAYVGARPDEILVGCGADEVLDIIAKTHLSPSRKSVIPVPTYSMYKVLSGQRQAEVVSVPRRPDYRLDVPGMIEALPGAGVVWLCVPNNPTGTAISVAAMASSKSVVVSVCTSSGEISGRSTVGTDGSAT